MIDIYIPSYHRADNLKTVKYLKKIGYNMENVTVFIDSEADDKEEYRQATKGYGCNLAVFDMNEARERYDYVHRPSVARRSAGQARNMFHDYARKENVQCYIVMDDDTKTLSVRLHGQKERQATIDEIIETFEAVKEFMERRHIGLFGLSQTGDLIGGDTSLCLYRYKVMNLTFYLTKYIYRGERGVQDDDTSQFVGVMNEGYFTGSMGEGVILQQTPSAMAKGGLSDLYKECKLLNKSLVCPIQFPSAIYAERQVKNGGRLHHRINSKYLYPRIIKVNDEIADNIAWDRYKEDVPFTNEPKRHLT